MRRGLAVAVVVVAALFASASPGAARSCTISGTAGADVLQGTKRADVICGRGGPDRLLGLSGNDVIKGGSGNDSLLGGQGSDRLIAGKGRDSCQDGGNTFYRGCEAGSGNRPRPTGFWPDFICCPATPDLAAPEVRGVFFEEPYVDTSSEGSIGLAIEVSEHQSGVGRVEVGLEGPGGHWRDLSFESDNLFGISSTLVEVSPETAAGKYRVSSLSVTDRAGNRVAFDSTLLAEAGFDAEFDVFEGPDVEGPQLTEYSLSPASLDTNAGSGSVRFSLAATDDLSGVEDAAALIRLPESDPPLCFPCGRRAPSDLTSGTIYDGVWTEDFPLPRFAKPGAYEVSALVLYDRAGNRTAYDREELEGLGYPVEFTQTGAGDTEPPQVVDFWMSPGTLQTSKGNRAIQFFIHVKDDLSGVGDTASSVFEELRVDFEPPHASEWGYFDGGMTQVSGTALDGVWRFDRTLQPDAETGTWTIPAIAAIDHAGNMTLLRDEELEATDWDLTFENLP
jgi:RTX calcium-binding nonapeptide repeat (4 copies)